MFVRRLLLACTVTALAVWTAVALAAPGSPDLSLGQVGRVTIDRGGWESIYGLRCSRTARSCLSARPPRGQRGRLQVEPERVLRHGVRRGRHAGARQRRGRAGEAVALQPDGKIVVVGMTYVTQPGGPPARRERLARPELRRRRRVDRRRRLDAGHAVAVQPDGKILVAPQTRARGAIFRVNTDGSSTRPSTATAPSGSAPRTSPSRWRFGRRQDPRRRGSTTSTSAVWLVSSAAPRIRPSTGTACARSGRRERAG